jgi:hypothetical protein
VQTHYPPEAWVGRPGHAARRHHRSAASSRATGTHHSRETRREESLDAHLPDPIVDRADGIDPEHARRPRRRARSDILVREDTSTGTIVEVHGAENVARRAAAVSPLGLVGRPALINGEAGWVSLLDGDVFAIVALTLQNGRITTMDILLDPARLARLDLTAFASRP